MPSEQLHAESICSSYRDTERALLGWDKQMHGHRRTDLTNCRGELSTTTSKHRVLVVITKGKSSPNYTVVVHLADEHRNSSLLNDTSNPALLSGAESSMNKVRPSDKAVHLQQQWWQQKLKGQLFLSGMHITLFNARVLEEDFMLRNNEVVPILVKSWKYYAQLYAISKTTSRYMQSMCFGCFTGTTTSNCSSISVNLTKL